MANGRTPLFLTLLALVLLGAVVLLVQPYSADSTPYARPARKFIQAALREDSLDLARMATSPSPVTWALAAGRNHPDKLAQWTPRTEAFVGERRGDTVQVFVYPTGKVCDDAPIAFRFVGAEKDAKIADANSACLDAN
jgi:hypothetical protein